ncbi:hypothetical protein FRC06_002825 [Ceratobasidium sp. 370]|nr:hypothetical protein FRC06_002825 [Ceratobasidium sp. 370]
MESDSRLDSPPKVPFYRRWFQNNRPKFSANGRGGYFVMLFRGEWRHNECPVEKWYQVQLQHSQETQSATRFTTIQHWRKLEGPFYHEFLLIPLTDGSYYRLERVAEGLPVVDTIRMTGCPAYDLIEWYPGGGQRPSHSDRPSDLIAEIYFPCEFDILDVLAVFKSIQQHGYARNFILQSFNCYFICWTVLAVLTRRAANRQINITSDWFGTVLVDLLLSETVYPMSQIGVNNSFWNTAVKEVLSLAPNPVSVHESSAIGGSKMVVRQTTSSYDTLYSVHDFQTRYIFNRISAHAMRVEAQKLGIAAPSSSALLKSVSAWSSRTERGGVFFVQFHSGWRSPSCLVEEWYQAQLTNAEQHQSTTRFTTIQHYRTLEAPFFHEFLLIPLTDGSCYRVERTGVGSDVDAISLSGCTACDMIEWFPQHKHQEFTRGTPSELVYEVNFPTGFDILDVLEICYAIQQHQRAKKYTLQRYNCYFFCCTILSILAREIADVLGILSSDSEQGLAGKAHRLLADAVEARLWDDSNLDLPYDCLKDVIRDEMFRLGATATCKSSDKSTHVPETIDLFNFQDRIRQHIKAYSDRVSRHGLGFAENIRKDVEDTIAKIWIMVPKK